MEHKQNMGAALRSLNSSRNGSLGASIQLETPGILAGNKPSRANMVLGSIFVLATTSCSVYAASPLDYRPVPQGGLVAAPASAAAAPGYCSSSGGSTLYESISSVDITRTPSGNFKVTTKINIANPTGCTAGKPCPEYDSSPEYVNIWVDFNGDKQWSPSERIHDAALTGYSAISYFGTMTTVANFTVPADATDEPTWMRVNLGWGQDPNDPCLSSWTWGNVVDKQVQFETPKIEKINAKGINTIDDLPQTGKDVELTAILKVPAGYEVTKCSWSGDLKVGEGDPTNNCLYKYKPGTGPGPKKGTYGDKKVKLTITYKHVGSGATGQTDKDYEYKVFFGRDDDDDGDKIPNWFEYWRHNKAVNGLDAADVTFDITKGAGSYGAWSPNSGNIELGAAAAKIHYPNKIKVPAKTHCPGGTFGGAEGIDSVAEVLAHERQHETYWNNWNGGSPVWVVGKDRDSDDDTPKTKRDFVGDNLPDSYENSTSKTNPKDKDSCDLKIIKSPNYKWYGDQEFMCMKVGNGKTGNADKDWANPGKKAAAAKKASPSANVAEAQAGVVIPVTHHSGPPSSVSVPSGVVVAQAVDAFAHLSGNYAATGLDSDGDGKFEALILNVDIEVVDGGLYTLVAWLRDSSGNDVAWANYQKEFSPGTYTVDLIFSGEVLHESGFTGPLTVSNIEIRVDDSEMLVESVQDIFVTQPFDAADFSAPAVLLTGQYSDEGVDANDDGLFDTLDVYVGADINKPGSYTIIGELETATASIIDVVTTTMTLTANDDSVVLSFSGRQIFMSHESGPYLVKRVRITDGNGKIVAIKEIAHQTQAYDYQQFQHSGAWVAPQGFADSGLDLDADGYFDYLRVKVPLEANVPGSYRVSADLVSADGSVLASAESEVFIGGNSADVDLDFAGHLLYESGIDGPYEVERLTILAKDGEIADFIAKAHRTAAYDHKKFSAPLVTLTGSAFDSASDTNDNGLYDLLTVSFGVIPSKDGMVFASARLLDVNGNEIGTANSNVQMVAGTEQFIELKFEGKRIGSNGVDGPFEVRDLDVYSVFDPDLDVFKDHAFVTKAYEAAQFEGFAAPQKGDLDGDGDVDRDDIELILKVRNTPASGPDDPRDIDGDGTITGLDARKLVLLCTRPHCATE